MRLQVFLLTVALATLAWAQTPSGFTPQSSTKLEVLFNTTMVEYPGQLLPKAITANQPRIALSSNLLSADDTYMFLMLDLDIPPANGTAKRRVLLHAMVTDFKASQQNIDGMATMLVTRATGPVAYLSPSPPATDTTAHRYVEILLHQPANFSVQASDYPNKEARINFDLAAFSAKNSVGSPIAANFFTVDGRAQTSPSGTLTRSGGTVKNTLTPFEGTAARMMLRCGWTVLLSAIVPLAMTMM